MNLWQKILAWAAAFLAVVVLWSYLNRERFDWSDAEIHGTFQPRDELIELNDL